MTNKNEKTKTNGKPQKGQLSGPKHLKEEGYMIESICMQGPKRTLFSHQEGKLKRFKGKLFLLVGGFSFLDVFLS